MLVKELVTPDKLMFHFFTDLSIWCARDAHLSVCSAARYAQFGSAGYHGPGPITTAPAQLPRPGLSFAAFSDTLSVRFPRRRNQIIWLRLHKASVT